MKKIAIYGKGGIGKSTVAQNLAAALSLMEKNVLLIGCDPKSDSTRLILNGKNSMSVLDVLRTSCIDDVTLDMVMKEGFNGIRCVESGGPEPGVGCAGRGIITAIEFLEKKHVIEANDVDIVIYDVLGDVVCGGFAMPIREGKADEVYIVCSGECQSLYAANNIAKGIRRYSERSKVRLGGIICNERNIMSEQKVVAEFAKAIGTRIIQTISRSSNINKAEAQRKTIVEFDQKDKSSIEFMALAKAVLENKEANKPLPLNDEDMEKIYEFIWKQY